MTNCDEDIVDLTHLKMTNSVEDIIDLTDSFTLIDNRNLANEVIVLDDSLDMSKVAKTNKVKKSSAKSQSSRNKSANTGHRKYSSQFADCPICLEQLGKTPMASTKCGHVYCLSCLVVSLNFDSKCPTCRITLKGASAYHRLYLPLNSKFSL